MKISIVTPTFNEEENIVPLSEEVERIFKKLDIDYEQIIIDNCSTDNTQEKIRNLIKINNKIKAIFNLHNYGQSSSPFYAMTKTNGDAVIWIDSDFQNPPELIEELISKWKNGSQITLLRRRKTTDKFFIKILKYFFYKFINFLSDHSPEPNTTGVGIYDKKVIEILKNINDPNPYLRGMIFELGFKINFLDFEQQVRKFGKSKNNLFTLIDLALNGLVKHTKLLRSIVYIGFSISFILLIISTIYFALKLIFWDTFTLGMAPIIIGIFFIGSIQLFFLGIIGEYISTILSYSKNHPLIIEKERINFD